MPFRFRCHRSRRSRPPLRPRRASPPPPVASTSPPRHPASRAPLDVTARVARARRPARARAPLTAVVVDVVVIPRPIVVIPRRARLAPRAAVDDNSLARLRASPRRAARRASLCGRASCAPSREASRFKPSHRTFYPHRCATHKNHPFCVRKQCANRIRRTRECRTGRLATPSERDRDGKVRTFGTTRARDARAVGGGTIDRSTWRASDARRRRRARERRARARDDR